MLGKKRKGKNIDYRETGAVDKYPSYIMAVPVSMQDTCGAFEIVERLKEAAAFKMLSYKILNEDGLEVVLQYNEEEYSAKLYREPLELPELFTINHKFTEFGVARMKNAGEGIICEMTYGEDALISYHLQLKILDCAVPEVVGLVDFCSERILSGVWAHMAAEAKTPPAPSYLYSIQAVSGENEKEEGVWLHTHGLNRCGSVELEILNAGKEAYQNEATVIQTVAGNIITKDYLGGELEGFWISSFSEEQMLIGTWRYWKTALELFYPKLSLGGWKDRLEGHNADTGILMCYPNGDAYDKRNPYPIAVFDELLNNNPLMMISTQETERMKSLAEERLAYFLSEYKKEGCQGIMKFGILVDEEYREEDSANLEHLWFEVISVENDSVHCLRTQDAYYIKALNENTEWDISLKQMTDWILYTPSEQITPDSVYLLEQ